MDGRQHGPHSSSQRSARRGHPGSRPQASNSLPGFKPSLISGGLTLPSSKGTFTIITTHGYRFSFGPW